ncbi:MAG: PLP-dependent aminotransferase family protein [Actinomycetia bacterium]|nr:PLP-dependent aminotransferase family protein [Actinomycetes bacterium]
MASISFARGVPSPDILPVAELAECAAAVIEAEGQTILNYGPAFGYLPLREWVGAQHGVAADRVLLTPGSLMGFNFVAQHLLGGGGAAVVEAPTYDRTLGVLRGIGSAIEPVPLSKAGLDLDRVETLLGADPPPKLLYVIPTFQNPSGRTLSAGQRHALVELAAARGVMVFEDDPYRLVRYSGEPEPTLHELAGGEGVIFASSFSKTAAPGLRVGYLVLPEPLVVPLTAVAASSYIAPAQLPQAALFELIRRGRFEHTLTQTVDVLRARRDAMLAGLEAEMPEGTAWSEPDGGYFLWVDLPAGVDSSALLADAARAGVTFVVGTDFFMTGEGQNAMRLAFSFPSVGEIQDGVAILGALVRERAAAS